MSMGIVRNFFEIQVVMCLALSLELYAMESRSSQVPSLQFLAARSLLEEPSSSYSEEVDKLLAFNYCLLNFHEAWAGLTTQEVDNRDLKMNHIKALIPLKTGNIMVIDKKGKLCMVRGFPSTEILYTREIFNGSFSPNTSLNSFVVNRSQTHALSSSTDGSACLWLVDTGELLQRFCHRAAVLCATCNDAMTTLITGSADGCLSVWSLITGQLVHELSLSQELPSFVAVAFLSDNRFVAVAQPSRIFLLDLSTGQIVKNFIGKGMKIGPFCSFTKEGSILATDTSLSIELGSFTENQLKVCSVQGDRFIPLAYGLADQQEMIAVAGFEKETAEKGLYRLSLWRYPREEDHLFSPLVKIALKDQEITALAFTPDGQSLFFGTYKGLIGKMSFSYMASLLRLPQARLVIKLIKKALKGKKVDLSREEQSLFESLDPKIILSITTLFEKCSIEQYCS